MMIQQMPLNRVAGPVTADLVAAATVAGSQVAVTAIASVDYVSLQVKVPFKWCFASSAANAVTAFAAVGSHFKAPAGFHVLPTRGETAGDSLWIEADTASADVTNGYSYSTYQTL